MRLSLPPCVTVCFRMVLSTVKSMRVGFSSQQHCHRDPSAVVSLTHLNERTRVLDVSGCDGFNGAPCMCVHVCVYGMMGDCW